ncbi:20027_t:CDS:1, partial [Cetraspora pellucida]
KKNPNTNAKLSGIHVFGLNATDVEQECERKNERSNSFKPFNTLSESMKTKRSCRFFIQISEAFENEIPKFYNSFDQPVLQEVRFHIQNKNYLAYYQNKDQEKENHSLDAFLKVIDQGPISRNAY